MPLWEDLAGPGGTAALGRSLPLGAPALPDGGSPSELDTRSECAQTWLAWPVLIDPDGLHAQLEAGRSAVGAERIFLTFDCAGVQVVHAAVGRHREEGSDTAYVDARLERGRHENLTVVGWGVLNGPTLCSEIVVDPETRGGLWAELGPTSCDPERASAILDLLAVGLGIQIGQRIELSGVQRKATNLLRMEALAERIIEGAAEGIIALDGLDRIILFNHGAEVIFGYERHEVLGRPLETLVPEAVRAAHRGHLREFASGPAEVRHMQHRNPIRGRRKSGEIFPAEASISRVKMGDWVALSAVVRDVSDHLRERERADRAAEELARSNEELERFAYCASHELQEPLRMVEGYCKLLQRRYSDALDEDARKFLAFAVDGATRIRRMTDDLLEYARLMAPLTPQTVHLDEVFRDARTNLSAAEQASGAELILPPLPSVRGRHDLLVVLFQNLLSNAIKFASDAPPRIRVSGVSHPEEWQITVTDEGIGIAPEFQARIFDPFRRLRTHEAIPGNGLGLAMVQRIAEGHGGRVTVESEEGCGSSFHVFLPRSGAG